MCTTMTRCCWSANSKPRRVNRVFELYNPNPAGRAVGDCAIRALTVALDDPATVPTPTINVIDGSLTVDRIA